jgi:hypothetical protein
MKAYGGVDVEIHIFLTVVSFMPLQLYPQENNPQYPLDRRLGGPQSRSGLGEEEILDPYRTRILIPPSSSQ